RLPALEHAFAVGTRLHPFSDPAAVFQRGPRPSARPRPRRLETADLAMWTSWETEVTAHILTTGETSHGYCFPRGLRGGDRPGEGAPTRLPGGQRHLFPKPHRCAARLRRGRERRHHSGVRRRLGVRLRIHHQGPGGRVTGPGRLRA